MLQVRRSLVRDPISSINFFILLNPSSFTIALGFTQPLTELSAKNRKKCFWGVESGERLRLTALPPSVSQLSRQCGILNISQPYRPPRPVTGIALLILCSLRSNSRNQDQIFITVFFLNPILFAICTSTFSKLCKRRLQ
jgi:hypothetical protein